MEPFSVESVIPTGLFHADGQPSARLPLSARCIAARMLGSSRSFFVLRRAASSADWIAAASLPPELTEG